MLDNDILKKNKILIIGNKPLNNNDNTYYKKLGQFINNNFDIIIRYNNCNNYDILQTNVHILILNLNNVFFQNYQNSLFNKVKNNNSLKTILLSTSDINLFTPENMKKLGIPNNINKLFFINKDIFNDIYNKNILNSKSKFFVYLRTLPVIISYILNVFKNSEIYVYGFDIYNRNIDIFTKFGYFHQYSDLLEELYFISLLKENKIKLLDTYIQEKKLSIS